MQLGEYGSDLTVGHTSLYYTLNVSQVNLVLGSVARNPPSLMVVYPKTTD